MRALFALLLSLAKRAHMIVIDFFLTILNLIRTARSAAKCTSRRTRTPIAILNTSLLKSLSNMPLTQVESRMAFYAKILKSGRLTLNDEEAEEWRRDLPAAIRGQHIILDRGELPVAMTLANVRRLKTLAFSNENFGAVQRDGLGREGCKGDGVEGSEPGH